MNIKMICPTETIENAKKARDKLIYLMYECQNHGKKEARWMISELTTRFFVCFGAGYCISLGSRLIGLSTTKTIVISSIFVITGIMLSLRLPLLCNTGNIMKHSQLMKKFRIMNAIIVSLNTLSSIMSETPSLISSEGGEEVTMFESNKGDISIETRNKRYVFPLASEYTDFSDEYPGMATMNFHPADYLIEEIRLISGSG